MRFVATFQVPLSDEDGCSLIALEEVFGATESGFIEVAASLFAFSLNFLLTELIIATLELCEAAAVFSILTSLLAVGAMDVEGEVSAVLFISICTSDFSELFTS